MAGEASEWKLNPARREERIRTEARLADCFAGEKIWGRSYLVADNRASLMSQLVGLIEDRPAQKIVNINQRVGGLGRAADRAI